MICGRMQDHKLAESENKLVKNAVILIDNYFLQKPVYWGKIA